MTVNGFTMHYWKVQSRHVLHCSFVRLFFWILIFLSWYKNTIVLLFKASWQLWLSYRTQKCFWVSQSGCAISIFSSNIQLKHSFGPPFFSLPGFLQMLPPVLQMYFTHFLFLVRALPICLFILSDKCFKGLMLLYLSLHIPFQSSFTCL